MIDPVLFLFIFEHALDGAGIANRLIIQGRDNDTRLFRVSLEADFINNRTAD